MALKSPALPVMHTLLDRQIELRVCVRVEGFAVQV